MKATENIINVISDIVNKVADYIEHIGIALSNSYKKLSEAFEKDLLPKLSVYKAEVSKLFNQLFDVLTNVIFTFLAKVKEFGDLHQQEIKQVMDAVNKVFSDMGKALFKTVRETKQALEQEIIKILEEIKKLPIVEKAQAMFNELFGELHIRDLIVNFITETSFSIQGALANPDAQELVKQLTEYINKKIKNEPVSEKELEKLTKLFVKVIEQIVKSVRFEDEPIAAKKPIFNLDLLAKLPKLVEPDSSIINYLSGNLVDSDEDQFLYNVAFNPAMIVPPLRSK